MNMLNIVGIDIGSVALSLLVIDETGSLIHPSLIKAGRDLFRVHLQADCAE